MDETKATVTSNQSFHVVKIHVFCFHSCSGVSQKTKPYSLVLGSCQWCITVPIFWFPDLVLDENSKIEVIHRLRRLPTIIEFCFLTFPKPNRSVQQRTLHNVEYGWRKKPRLTYFIDYCSYFFSDSGNIYGNKSQFSLRISRHILLQFGIMCNVVYE